MSNAREDKEEVREEENRDAVFQMTEDGMGSASSVEEKEGMPGKAPRLLRILAPLCIILILMVLIRSAFPLAAVKGDSMYPNIRDGYLALARSVFVDIDYGDVVLADASGKEGEGSEEMVIIKRVIAKGGDTIYAEDGDVYVNGVLQEEVYVYGMTEDFDEVTVPEGSYFLMGDNRGISLDSRVLGTFSEDEIIGEVVEVWK